MLSEDSTFQGISHASISLGQVAPFSTGNSICKLTRELTRGIVSSWQKQQSMRELESLVANRRNYTITATNLSAARSSLATCPMASLRRRIRINPQKVASCRKQIGRQDPQWPREDQDGQTFLTGASPCVTDDSRSSSRRSKEDLTTQA